MHDNSTVPEPKPPITAELIWSDQLRFGATSGPSAIVIDGDGAAGPSPMQLAAWGVAGCMATDVALNPELATAYPFNRLSGPANVLVMPALHSASISTKMLQELGGSTVIGPLLVGLSRPAQIARVDATVSDLVNAAVLAAHDAIR